MKAKRAVQKKARKAATHKNALGEAIIEGLKDVLAYKQGKLKLPTYEYHAPEYIEVAPLRAKLGMSQNRFAHAFGLNVATVRDWEQGRRQPDAMARILLAIIARHPEVVQGVLKEYQ